MEETMFIDPQRCIGCRACVAAKNVRACRVVSLDDLPQRHRDTEKKIRTVKNQFVAIERVIAMSFALALSF